MRNYENLPQDHQEKIIDTIIDLFNYSFWSSRKKTKAIDEAKSREWEYSKIQGINFLFGNKPREDVVSVIIDKEKTNKEKSEEAG